MSSNNAISTMSCRDEKIVDTEVPLSKAGLSRNELIEDEEKDAFSPIPSDLVFESHQSTTSFAPLELFAVEEKLPRRHSFSDSRSSQLNDDCDGESFLASMISMVSSTGFDSWAVHSSSNSTFTTLTDMPSLVSLTGHDSIFSGGFSHGLPSTDSMFSRRSGSRHSGERTLSYHRRANEAWSTDSSSSSDRNSNAKWGRLDPVSPSSNSKFDLPLRIVSYNPRPKNYRLQAATLRRLDLSPLRRHRRRVSDPKMQQNQKLQHKQHLQQAASLSHLAPTTSAFPMTFDLSKKQQGPRSSLKASARDYQPEVGLLREERWRMERPTYEGIDGMMSAPRRSAVVSSATEN